MIYDVMIIGAGPAGMTAAIAASEKGKRVLLLEANEKVGKKILVTGNGRCNLTNEVQGREYYRSDNPDQAQQILSAFTPQDTMQYFHQLGILTRSKNGYVYPYNEQAAAVREAFELRIQEDPGITLMTDSYVIDVEATKKGFLIRCKDRKYSGRSVIVTTGGLAAPKMGCDGSGYGMAKAFGHRLIRPLPALTPLKSSAPFLKKASGVRNQASINLLVEEVPVAREQGELQWTDYGISGVAIFQISRFAIQALEEKKKVSLVLDFVPEWSAKELKEECSRLKKICSYKKAGELLYGILPLKLISIVLREARVEEDKKAGELTCSEMDAICQVMKCFTLRINGYMGYDKAQVTRGGVSLSELGENLQSIYQPGLFFAGELVDVDGSCGGYNLQWAFSSGMVAGRAAAAYLS